MVTVKMAAAEEQQSRESALASTVKDDVEKQQPQQPCLTYLQYTIKSRSSLVKDDKFNFPGVFIIAIPTYKSFSEIF